jgi:adenylate cyclase
MIVLPEKDFIGFVTRNNRTGLVMSLAIVVIAVLLAMLLVRQGLRGDRAARLVRERARAMARQSEALELVAEEADLFDPSQAERPQALTETAAEITGARRANLWYLLPGRSVLRCADSWDSETSRHSGGFELDRDELPQFFDHVAAGTAIDATDAARDPRTAEAYRVLMAPFGSRSLSVIPMRCQGHVVGAICLEDASNHLGTRHSLRVLASMAALRPTEATGEGGTKPHGLDIQTSSHTAEPMAVRSLSSDLTLRGLDKEALGEAFYPEVAVLIMRIDEPISAANGGISPPELIDSIVCAMRRSPPSRTSRT